MWWLGMSHSRRLPTFVGSVTSSTYRLTIGSDTLIPTPTMCVSWCASLRGARPHWSVALGPSTSPVHALMPPAGGAKRASASSNSPAGLSLGPLLGRLTGDSTSSPMASGVAPEPKSQEAEGKGQSLSDGEVAPEPQREAEQLLSQEPSEVVTGLVEVQPTEAAQTTPAQEPGSSIVKEALSSVPWLAESSTTEVWTGQEEVVEEQVEPTILHDESWWSQLESLPSGQTPETALAEEPAAIVSPPSSAGQQLDDPPMAAEEPSSATPSEAAVTDGSSGSAGQVTKGLDEEIKKSTPDALSEAATTISTPPPPPPPHTHTHTHTHTTTTPVRLGSGWMVWPWPQRT